MSDPISDERLAEMQARANAAMPAPWGWRRERNHSESESTGLASGPETRYDREKWVVRGSADCGGGEWFTDAEPHDRDFIAAARTDVPDLIAEVRRLREQIAAIEREREAKP